MQFVAGRVLLAQPVEGGAGIALTQAAPQPLIVFRQPVGVTQQGQ